MIGKKSKQLLAGAIAMFIVCGILLIMFVFLAVMLLGEGAEQENLFVLLFVGVLFLALTGASLGIYVPILVRLHRAPTAVIEKKEFDFVLWCGKDGSITVPCDAVVQAQPIRVFWTASLITMLSENYDATIQITLADGRVYKVPYVQRAKHVAAEVMRLAFEVRAQKEVLAFKAKQEQEGKAEDNQ